MKKWSCVILATIIAVLLWLLSAEYWHDMHQEVVIPDIELDEIIVTPDNSH